MFSLFWLSFYRSEDTEKKQGKSRPRNLGLPRRRAIFGRRTGRFQEVLQVHN
jgi:hypothetical protein